MKACDHALPVAKFINGIALGGEGFVSRREFSGRPLWALAFALNAGPAGTAAKRFALIAEWQGLVLSLSFAIDAQRSEELRTGARWFVTSAEVRM